MAVTVPNVPYRSLLTDQSGLVSREGSDWFEQLAKRTGGPIALTNIELEVLQSGNLDNINAEILALQTAVTALQLQVTTGLDALNQGQRL